MPNRLANETSPYLLQHSQQPVDWYPWGPEAFERARTTNRPIMLSVGYSTCHWCHVMAHESFDDPEIAAYLNEHFVCIKVDREERPDVDAIYMDAVVATTGRGGWPMTVFLTPDGRPFYGGTYFPPEDRMGMAGFPRVLAAILSAYRDRPDEVSRGAEQLAAYLQRGAGAPRASPAPNAGTLDAAFEALDAAFDVRSGGFGTAPKFPQPMALEFALRVLTRTGSPAAATIVRTTLDQMAAGGIQDQLGGGFHRYSVDGDWRVPHFEKMLYDNAQLSRIYALAYQATGITAYRGVASATIDYVLRDLRAPSGGFCAAEDADSEGVEGRFYVWTQEAIESTLDGRVGAVASRYWGVSEDGDLDGANVLHVEAPVDELARGLEMPPGEVAASIATARSELLRVRSGRVRPSRDGKVLASWNGLMLRALSDASVALDREDYRAEAVACAEYLASAFVDEGRVWHLAARPGVPRYGFLDDSASVAWGMLGLHQATLDRRWLDLAAQIASRMIELFWSEAERRFYDTSADHETLVARPHGLQDNATPSGSSLACAVLIDLGRLVDEPRYLEIAQSAVASNQEALAAHPTAFATALLALDSLLQEADVVTALGAGDDPGVERLLSGISRGYRPYQLARLESQGDRPQPAAFVCRGMTCGLPVSDPDALVAQLASPVLVGPGL